MLTGATGEHEAQERRQAARALLIRPILVAHRHPAELALVRRHAAALKSSFASLLGCHLVVESSFARLVKEPLSPDAPTRPARRGNGTAFTARTYTYLALICAGLLAPDVGEQVLVSHLVEQLRADAASTGVQIDDTLPERRNLVAAIELLVQWGVLVETDGTVAGWGERREEALLTITRGLLPHLLAHPLHSYSRPADLWAGHSDLPEQPRRTLRRKLVENPVVRREELTRGEADVLSRERTELTRLLDEAFGLTLEVRAEGALAYDTDDELTDVPFPGTGTVRQAALLLLDALVDTLRPTAGSEATIPGGDSAIAGGGGTVAGRRVPGVLAPWPLVEECLTDLHTRYAKMWRGDDPGRLRPDCVAVLTSLALATETADGLVVHPAAARYRPNPQVAPPKNRTRTRPRPGAEAATLFAQPEPHPETT